jgi:hypothetical protein
MAKDAPRQRVAVANIEIGTADSSLGKLDNGVV